MNALTYEEWVETLMENEHFDLPIRDVINILRVERSFINKHMCNNDHIAHIRLLPHVARKIEGRDDTYQCLYFNRDDVQDWLQREWKYTIQTRFIDLANLVSLERINEVCESLELRCGFRYPPHSRAGKPCVGWIDPRILKELNLPPLNVIEYDRLKLREVRVRAVDLFSSILHHPKDFVSNEIAYRTACRGGWIHCRFGRHKTIFVETEQKSYRVPFLVAATAEL